MNYVELELLPYETNRKCDILRPAEGCSKQSGCDSTGPVLDKCGQDSLNRGCGPLQRGVRRECGHSGPEQGTQ